MTGPRICPNFFYTVDELFFREPAHWRCGVLIPFREQLISDYYKYWAPEKNTRFRYSAEVTPDTQLVFDIPAHRLLDRLVK